MSTPISPRPPTFFKARGTLMGMCCRRYAQLMGAALLALSAHPASLPSCDAGAAKYRPCEFRYQWNEGELARDKSPFRDELLNIEFRGPDHTTYLMRAFWDGGRTLRVRFTPNQAGAWYYRVTSDIKRFEVRESSFAVADDPSHGFISVANIRHWWTDDKQPHLWASAEVPWLDLDEATFQSMLDARKQDGFTHLRGLVLASGSGGAPLDAQGDPNFAYFNKLDDRLVAAHNAGMVLDLILASDKFLDSGMLDDWRQRAALLRYVVSRYAPLNVTWQGVEHFEDRAGTRALLKEIGDLLNQLDSYRHPRSTGARQTSSVLLRDGWENYIVEGSPDPQLGAVEHQITAAPQIHVVQGTEADAFRRELWQSTTNGEYPSVSYAAAQNSANLQAMRVWIKTMSDVRHWEFEPFFDIDGARAVGLENVEYLLYADHPATVEIQFPEKHKYNPRWINPRTGETVDIKDVKQDTFSADTPQGGGDWILQMPREGRKEGMLKSYKFESQDAPVQEIELNAAKVPFDVLEPSSNELDSAQPITYKIKLKRTNRATRMMQYIWTGEIVAEGEGARVLALGSSGTFELPENLGKSRPALLNVRVNAINANGKAYAVEKAYQISK